MVRTNCNWSNVLISENRKIMNGKNIDTTLNYVCLCWERQKMPIWHGTKKKSVLEAALCSNEPI